MRASVHACVCHECVRACVPRMRAVTTGMRCIRMRQHSPVVRCTAASRARFAQAAKVMRRVDANDDGVMDLREFEAYFERTSRALYAFRCRQRKQEKKQCARVRLAAAAVPKAAPTCRTRRDTPHSPKLSRPEPKRLLPMPPRRARVRGFRPALEMRCTAVEMRCGSAVTCRGRSARATPRSSTASSTRR